MRAKNTTLFKKTSQFSVYELKITCLAIRLLKHLKITLRNYHPKIGLSNKTLKLFLLVVINNNIGKLSFRSQSSNFRHGETTISEIFNSEILFSSIIF